MQVIAPDTAADMARKRLTVQWYQWGREDWRELGRHCGSIERGEIVPMFARAYKRGYRDARDEMVA